MQPGTFFFPGPTEVQLDILRAMLQQPIPHRSPEFRALFADVQRRLQLVFRTARPVYVATASGTGMMEAAIRCAPQGKLLALVNGAFAERFVTIAHACGRATDRLDVPLGDVPEPGAVTDALARGSYSAVTVVHSETSTGALADLAGIARVVHDAEASLIVDSVSGIAGAPLETDAWGLDCVVSASQKALALPPGLAFAVASEPFLGSREPAHDEARGVYLDLAEFDRHLLSNETPATPSVSLIFALARQLSVIADEGMEVRWSRHEAMREVMAEWVMDMSSTFGPELHILAREGARSPTVTVVTLPDVIHASALVREVALRGYVIGAGYGVLRETTFRVGHMGDHTVPELRGCLGAVADALRALHPLHPVGTGSARRLSAAPGYAV